MPTHIPILRWGEPYKSLDVDPLVHFDSGEPIAEIGRANPGLIERDVRQERRARRVLCELSFNDMLAKCKKAGELFLNGDLPLGDSVQSPDQFVHQQSATTGLPEHMCVANMKKVHRAFDEMGPVLDALTRGLDGQVLSKGFGIEPRGVPISYQAQCGALGMVLPNNSPGVHALWIPALAMQIGVMIKPGSQEPWTPYRIAQSMFQAGVPKQAIGYYPGQHDIGGTFINSCKRCLIFGGAQTVEQHRGNPRIQVHGPGFSKILLGDDTVDRWRDYLDVMVESVLVNGGRSCINCSSIWVPRHGKAIAEALAERLGPIEPLPPDDPKAALAAFTVPTLAEAISAEIDSDVSSPNVHDMTAKFGPRLVRLERCAYLRPTVVHCASLDAPQREYLFPFVSVYECPEEKMAATLGPTLVCTAITENPRLQRELLDTIEVDRLNLGPIPTTRLNWLQPHEGNLVEFLFRARAFQHDSMLKL